jgi:Rrf2 family protein
MLGGAPESSAHNLYLDLSIGNHDNTCMRISQKAKYAVTAALDLALHAPGPRGARSAGIARRTGVPAKFLEAILRDLREAGLVTSRRGPDGGHRLGRDPERVTVLAIVQAIDGPLSAALAAGRPEMACLRSLWARVETSVRDQLGAVTLDDLRREAREPGPLDFSI